MTKVRQVYLQNQFVLADAGEYVFNIGTQDIITRLDIEMRATNGATNNRNATAQNTLLAVELMNGSEPIVSLTGDELAGMVSYRNAEFPQGVYSETPSAVQYTRMSVNFGRWYCDEQMALDLSKFDNLQMRVRWNLAAVNAVGATGFITGSGRLTVIAHIMDGAQNPMGYLSLKRHAAFTSAASGDQPVYLPTDKVIRTIYVRALEAGTAINASLTNARLLLNEGKERPFDLSFSDILDSLNALIGRLHYKHVFHPTNGDTISTLFRWHEILTLATEVIDTIDLYVNTGIGEGAVVRFTASTGAALATNAVANAMPEGYAPFATVAIPFGTYDDPNSWLNAPQYKQARLELTQGNAGAAVSVLLEQLNTY